MIELYRVPRFKPYPKPIVIDLGCNVGFESQKLYNIFNPSLLISVDPFEYNIFKTEELRGNQPNWAVDCCAIAEQSGIIEMSYTISEHTNNSPCGGIIVGEPRNVIHRQLVKTKRLNEIHPFPDIIKVDIEGYEWLVFDQLIESTAKIIFLELHGTDMLPISEQFAKITQLKQSFNLRWFEYAQAQKLDPDLCTECNEDVFKGLGSYCHVLCERK